MLKRVISFFIRCWIVNCCDEYNRITKYISRIIHAAHNLLKSLMVTSLWSVQPYLNVQNIFGLVGTLMGNGPGTGSSNRVLDSLILEPGQYFTGNYLKTSNIATSRLDYGDCHLVGRYAGAWSLLRWYSTQEAKRRYSAYHWALRNSKVNHVFIEYLVH